MALRVPDPDSSRPGDVNIPATIDFHSVGNSFASSARFLAKNATVCERSVGPEIINSNVALFAVVHIKLLSIGRERQTIGLGKFLSEQRGFSRSVQAKHALKIQLLLFARDQIQRGIGKIQRAIRPKDHVVWAVELFPLE